ncbi:hypothetical protein B0H14DRAFT_2864724 [Mycena olivaceomarginata]|nr:hypothetical protein B0H14DRAFT_2864724 [Mycena olivaceomarginata]
MSGSDDKTMCIWGATTAHASCPAPTTKPCASGTRRPVPSWGGRRDTPTGSRPWPSLPMAQAYRTAIFDSLSSFLPASFSSPITGMLAWIPSPLLLAQTGPNATAPGQPTDLNSLLLASLDMSLWLSSCGTTYDHCSHSSNQNTYRYHSFPALSDIFFYPLFTPATNRSHSSLCINFVPSLSHAPHTCPLPKLPSAHDALGHPSDSLPVP